MSTSKHDFDHATLNIPGITIPSDPVDAERALVAHVQAARNSAGASIPHAAVMSEMRSRIEYAAQHAATSGV